MSPVRLTPTRIAEREIQRLWQREERLLGELQAIRSDKARWQSVLDALNGLHPEEEPES